MTANPVSAHKSRRERKADIAAYMIGKGALTALEIARAIGLKKSPHLMGILWEMVEDAEMGAGRYGDEQRWEYRFTYWGNTDEGAISIEDLPF